MVFQPAKEIKMSNSRNEYLKGLAEDFSTPLSTVLFLAELLGEEEDEDQLITMLEDLELQNDDL